MTRLRSFGCGYAVLAAFLLFTVFVQAQQANTLVIEGGTLIDGNGGAPVPNAVVIIQGNKIATISRKGQVSYPANAQVIRADGKFILPGYWEAESVHKWYLGEAEINYGITSVSDIGEGGELLMLHHNALKRGKISGPRLFTGIARIGPLSFDTNTGLETSLAPGQLPKSAEDARTIAKRMLAAGADLINLQGGNFPVEYYRAAIEEGHKVGKAAFVRPSGPLFRIRDAADVGGDIVSHSDGIPIAIAKDPSKFANGVSVTTLDVGMAAALSTSELDVYADMDDAKAAELIKLMVDHKMSLAPTLIRKGAGFHKENEMFQVEARNWWLSNPNLRAYYPEEMFHSELLEMTPQEMSPALWEQRKKGYQNLLRFHGDFVKAGGHLMAGCNAPFIRPPGICMHQELQLFADAGLTPMQLVQSVTKWPAESFRQLDKVGTIEVGKMADVVITNADPLQDHRNLQNINSVILDGKVQTLGYHPDYAVGQPFRAGSGLDMNLIVEDLEWVTALKAATYREGPQPSAPPGGPVRVSPPAIETLSPFIFRQGAKKATFSIKGFNFTDRCLVYLDKTIVPSHRVSRTEIQVTLDENLLARPGVYELFVKQPGPLINQQGWHARDGWSNKARILVDFDYDQTASLNSNGSN